MSISINTNGFLPGTPYTATANFPPGVTGPVAFSVAVPAGQRVIVDTIGVGGEAALGTTVFLFSATSAEGGEIKIGPRDGSLPQSPSGWQVPVGETPQAALFPNPPGLGEQVDVQIFGRLVPG